MVDLFLSNMENGSVLPVRHACAAQSRAVINAIVLFNKQARCTSLSSRPRLRQFLKALSVADYLWARYFRRKFVTGVISPEVWQPVHHAALRLAYHVKNTLRM